MVFDDNLGSTNSTLIEQFFIGGRHNNLDFVYLSQSCFDSPRRTIRKISNKKFVFNQTLKDIENIYRDVAGYDMSFDEFKQIRRKQSEEGSVYLLLIDLKKISRKIVYLQ